MHTERDRDTGEVKVRETETQGGRRRYIQRETETQGGRHRYIHVVLYMYR